MMLKSTLWMTNFPVPHLQQLCRSPFIVKPTGHQHLQIRGQVTTEEEGWRDLSKLSARYTGEFGAVYARELAGAVASVPRSGISKDTELSRRAKKLEAEVANSGRRDRGQDLDPVSGAELKPCGSGCKYPHEKKKPSPSPKDSMGIFQYAV